MTGDPFIDRLINYQTSDRLVAATAPEDSAAAQRVCCAAAAATLNGERHPLIDFVIAVGEGRRKIPKKLPPGFWASMEPAAAGGRKEKA